MSRRRPRLLPIVVASAVVVGLVASACGDDRTDVAVGGPAAPDPDAAVLVIETGGGFTTPEWSFRTLPTLAVYADGRAVSLGAQIMIYPGAALPPLFVAPLDDEGLAGVVDAARRAGLDTADVDYGSPPVADVPATVVTVVIDGVTYVHRIEALGFDDDPSLTPEQQAARIAVGEFIAATSDLRSLVGAEHVGPDEPYVAERFRLWVRPAAEADVGTDGGIEPTVVPWTVDGVTLAVSPCLPVEGVEAQQVGALLAEANELTRFAAGGQTWAVTARPVLPHEPTCPADG